MKLVRTLMLSIVLLQLARPAPALASPSASSLATELATEEPLLLPVETATNPAPAPIGWYPCVIEHTCYLDEYAHLNPNVAPVPNVERIQLLGRGLISKRTRQLFGVACLDTDGSCQTLRFIYQVSPKEVSFVGPAFRVNPHYKGGSQKALKKAMRSLYSDATDSGQRGLKFFAGSLVLAFGAAFLFNVTFPAIAIFTIGLAKGASGGEKHMGISSFPAFDAASHFHNATKTDAGSYLHNQNGWNWHANPAKLREKAFGNILMELQVSNGFFSGSSSAVRSGAIQGAR